MGIAEQENMGREVFKELSVAQCVQSRLESKALEGFEF